MWSRCYREHVIMAFAGDGSAVSSYFPATSAPTNITTQFAPLKIQREQREMDLNLTVAELPQGPMQKKDIG